MKSLRSRVFKQMESNSIDSPLQLYKIFPDSNKQVVRQYYYQYLKPKESNINIEITNIDTIKEMELSINQIKDPVKRCENLSRLHAMKLRPIKNQDKRSLKELLDGSN